MNIRTFEFEIPLPRQSQNFPQGNLSPHSRSKKSLKMRNITTKPRSQKTPDYNIKSSRTSFRPTEFRNILYFRTKGRLENI